MAALSRNKIGAEREVLRDREVHERAAPLRDMRDAALSALVCAHRDYVLAIEQDRATRGNYTRERAQRRCLAGAVRAEESDDLALLYLEIDAV